MITCYCCDGFYGLIVAYELVLASVDTGTKSFLSLPVD